MMAVFAAGCVSQRSLRVTAPEAAERVLVLRQIANSHFLKPFWKRTTACWRHPKIMRVQIRENWATYQEQAGCAKNVVLPDSSFSRLVPIFTLHGGKPVRTDV